MTTTVPVLTILAETSTEAISTSTLNLETNILKDLSTTTEPVFLETTTTTTPIETTTELIFLNTDSSLLTESAHSFVTNEVASTTVNVRIESTILDALSRLVTNDDNLEINLTTATSAITTTTGSEPLITPIEMDYSYSNVTAPDFLKSINYSSSIHQSKSICINSLLIFFTILLSFRL